jgi:Predicted membrane protein (DUF2157)
MLKRSISTRRRDWLCEELQAWRAQAILSEDQSNRILALYEVPSEISERQRSRAVFTLMAVAGLFVGLAVLLLIGYNWEAIPAGLKLSIIFGAIIGTHTGGFYLRYTRGAGGASELAFFLACLLYGAGIWLVAQIFHLNAHYPDGMWWWAVGVLLFALCLDNPLLHALFVGLLGLWVGMEVLGFRELGAWFLGRWRQIPNGAYTLPVLALPGLLWAYRKEAPTTVGLYVPLLAWWVILQPFAWGMEKTPIYFIGGMGAFFLLIAETHRSGSPFAIPYRLWGALMMGGVLVPLSFYGFYDFDKEVFWHGLESGGFVQMLAIVVLAIATMTTTWLVRRRTLGDPLPFLEQLTDFMRRQWLPFVLVVLMAFLALWELLVHTALVPTILANIAMIGCGIWLLATGLREDRGRPFAAGILYLLLWAVLRYVDLFGEFGGLLGAALMFFLCGATLFGVALYWRQRKGGRRA